jgi:hypothetical protein
MRQGRAQGLAEGLLIFGWVAMWCLIEFLLYEHWESHLDLAVLDRLVDLAVDYSFVTDATFKSWPHLQAVAVTARMTGAIRSRWVWVMKTGRSANKCGQRSSVCSNKVRLLQLRLQRICVEGDA